MGDYQTGITVNNFILQKSHFKTYPNSTRNLNRLTRTVDVTIYDENSAIVEIVKMPEESPIKVYTSRLKGKDRELGVLKLPESLTVDVNKRIDLIKRRNRAPIIYHKITADKLFSTFNIQIRNINPYK